ncbi:MAG: TldD/PmbA family protein [Candidatus Nanoarchaeia archaeon]
MLNEELIELAEYAKKLLLKKKATDVVISLVENHNDEIKFVNNEPVKTGSDITTLLSFFAVFDKKIVMTSAKELSKQKIKQTVNNLEKFASQILPKPDYFGIAEGPFKYKKIPNLFDKNFLNLSGERQLEYVEAAINAALSQGATKASGILNLNYNDCYLTTSRSVTARSKRSIIYFSIRALLDKDASGHETVAARMLKDFDAVKAGITAGELARLSKNPQLGKAGKYDVIFAPLAFAPLLSCIGNACSIFDVEAGLSFFANKINKRVANPCVTIIDAGNLPGGIGATEFDSEGVPSQRNILIDKGILKTFLYNASFARKYKTKTTANAGLISPSPWFVLLKPGELSKEELIAEVKNGLYISNTWYTRFQNYSTGDFSTIPRDSMFIVKNGKLDKPVKGLRVSENMLHILQNISALANDAKQVYSWELASNSPVMLPHVLVKDLNVTRPTA